MKKKTQLKFCFNEAKLKGKFCSIKCTYSKRKNKSHNNLRFHVRNQEKRVN